MYAIILKSTSVMTLINDAMPSEPVRILQWAYKSESNALSFYSSFNLVVKTRKKETYWRLELLTWAILQVQTVKRHLLANIVTNFKIYVYKCKELHYKHAKHFIFIYICIYVKKLNWMCYLKFVSLITIAVARKI